MTPDLRNAFIQQARACANLDSPFMGRMLPLLVEAIDPDSALGNRLRTWPTDRLTATDDAVALRLAGGLHALHVSGNPVLAETYPPNEVSDAALSASLRQVCAENQDHILRWLDLPPQTNEVRRAAVLIACGHWLTARYGKMLVLSEIGASAGLNLNWDFFRMDVVGQVFGPADSPVRLSPDWRGTAPLHCPAYVHEARGVDLNPLDPNAAQDALRLQSYIWPDQPERMARTKAAIAVAQEPDTEATGQMTRADALDWLPERLIHRSPYAHMLYSTVAWQYLSDAARARGEAMIATAGATATDDSPLAWFRMETDGQSPGAALTLRLWPGDITLDMGRVDFHGRWVDWRAPEP